MPERNQHDQQRNRLHEVHVTQVGDIRKEDSLRIGQAIDKIFQYIAQHRLARSEDQESKDTQQEKTQVRPDIAQQPQINPKI
ncbi:hypothetical protein D9M68_835460 [compost metagenome]